MLRTAFRLEIAIRACFTLAKFTLPLLRFGFSGIDFYRVKSQLIVSHQVDPFSFFLIIGASPGWGGCGGCSGCFGWITTAPAVRLISNAFALGFLGGLLLPTRVLPYFLAGALMILFGRTGWRLGTCFAFAFGLTFFSFLDEGLSLLFQYDNFRSRPWSMIHIHFGSCFWFVLSFGYWFEYSWEWFCWSIVAWTWRVCSTGWYVWLVSLLMMLWSTWTSVSFI